MGKNRENWLVVMVMAGGNIFTRIKWPGSIFRFFKDYLKQGKFGVVLHLISLGGENANFGNNVKATV